MGHYSHSDIEEAVKSASTEGLEDYLYQEPKAVRRENLAVIKIVPLSQKSRSHKNRAALTKISQP